MSSNNMNQSKVGYPSELRRIADMIGGNTSDPNAPSLLNDAWWGSSSVPDKDLFGTLGAWAPELLSQSWQGGKALGQLGAEATNNGYYGSQGLANMAFGLAANDGWQNASNQFAQKLHGAINGTNIGGGQGGGSFGPSGLSERVANEALNAQAKWKGDIYDRAIADARPQARSAWSSRGMGGGGASIRGEEDMIQRVTDQMTQQDVQNRIASLGVAANAAGQAGSESVGWGNIGLGRGSLALQASQLPGQVQGQFLQNMLQAQQAQGAPLSMLGTGAQLFQQSQQMPLSTFNNLYQTSRAPQTTAVNLLGGSAGTFNNPIGGKMGIPVRY